MNHLSKQQQNAILEMYNFSIVRPKLVSMLILKILKRKHLTHIPWAFRINTDEAKQLFSEMEIYRDYGNGAQGLVLSMFELETETNVDYCVEKDALTSWLPF